MSLNLVEPQKKYKFLVEIDAFATFGFTKCSKIGMEIDNIEHRNGNDQNAPFNYRGLAKYMPITLERGITHDRSAWEWARQGYDPMTGFGMTLYKRNMNIIQLNDDNTPAKVYKCRGCYCRVYGVGDWDSMANEVSIESMEVMIDGFDLAA